MKYLQKHRLGLALAGFPLALLIMILWHGFVWIGHQWHCEPAWVFAVLAEGTMLSGLAWWVYAWTSPA